ncbi:hypothetical protein, partial [Rhodoflexus sp.]
MRPYRAGSGCSGVRFAPVLRCAAHRPAGALRIPHATPAPTHTPPRPLLKRITYRLPTTTSVPGMPFPVLTASGLTTAAPPEAFHPPMPS